MRAPLDAWCRQWSASSWVRTQSRPASSRKKRSDRKIRGARFGLLVLRWITCIAACSCCGSCFERPAKRRRRWSQGQARSQRLSTVTLHVRRNSHKLQRYASRVPDCFTMHDRYETECVYTGTSELSASLACNYLMTAALLQLGPESRHSSAPKHFLTRRLGTLHWLSADSGMS